ncbi:MAG: nucleoside/nucleotide kinase family protein [Thermomicrobiales bacterium]|nr:nucleoside/nucleotide kinase family protein [Thermomicrobiales bacterium]
MTEVQNTNVSVMEADIPYLVTLARSLVQDGRRRILGIAGPPGAGKSTLSAALLGELGDLAVLVGMDGFHLANQELLRLGRRDRKGAPDTFDTDGYTNLLRRLRDQNEGAIYAPAFDRSIEESIGSAIPVLATTPLVITEGNYLLSSSEGWANVRELLDQAWFLDVDHDVRKARLIARRQSFGDTLADATAWVQTVDEANATVIENTRSRADLIIRLPASR